MGQKKVRAAYFSATDTTMRVVTFLADRISAELGLGPAQEPFDFTLPRERAQGKAFSSDEAVVFGVPVYAGRVPNVLLKFLAEIAGNGALAVPVVLYGNRNYDDALIELRDILEKDGFHTVAAAAFVGEHSFSRILGAGRPDEADFALAGEFAREAAGKLRAVWEKKESAGGETFEQGPVPVRGETPIRGYYQPRDRKGTPIDIRKVLPKTGPECTKCGLCARLCPMGSIDPEDVSRYTGICIKCGACIKKCPENARYYDDEGYLYHQHELEEGYTRRAEPEFFL